MGFWPFHPDHQGADLSGNSNHASLHNLEVVNEGPSDHVKAAYSFSPNRESFASIAITESLKVQSFTLLFEALCFSDEFGPVLFYGDSTRKGVGINVKKSGLQGNFVSTSFEDRQAAYSYERSSDWEQFAVRFDSSSRSMLWMKDENPIATQHPHGNLATQFNITIGTNPYEGSHFHGYLSCILLYNVSLSANEIEQAWQVCDDYFKDNTDPPFVSNILAFWPLHPDYEGRDLSGNGNHAKLYNVETTNGPSNDVNAAYSFSPDRESYASILSSESLNFRKSFTLLFDAVCRSSHFGPVLFYGNPSTQGVGIYVKQNGLMVNFVSIDFENRYSFVNDWSGSSEWKQYAIRFDSSHGESLLWRDDQNKFAKMHIPGQLATQFNVTIGAMPFPHPDASSHFYGSLSCLLLFNVTLNTDEIEDAWDSCDRYIRYFSQQGQSGTPNIGATESAVDVAMTIKPGRRALVIFMPINVGIDNCID